MSEDEDIRATILDWLPRVGAISYTSQDIAYRFKFGLPATRRVLESLAEDGLIKQHISVSYGPAPGQGERE